MFDNEELKTHIESSYTVESRSALIAEWNMNIPGNFYKFGNYRYRKNTATSPYNALPNLFDRNDDGGYYTGGTDADITIESGLETDTNTPLLFTFSKAKEKLYYSLEDCFKPFRPRSGINKASFFNNKYFNNVNQDMYLRPRYYMPHRDDEFKYWRSYRTESDKIQSTSILSATAKISSYSGTGPWTGTITEISSTTNLKIGSTFTVTSPNISFGASVTVGSITGAGPWIATVTGVSATEGLVVGDRITATDGTGKLFGGTPTSVVILSIVPNVSVTYQVTGGTAPIAGTVTNIKNIPGSLGIGIAKVESIINGSSITFSLSGGTELVYQPVLGMARSLSINDTKTNIEYGISKQGTAGIYSIDDAVPFVVYKEEVPSNRIILKVQTNTGNIDLGPFKNSGSIQYLDPFFGSTNRTVPKSFKIQYLDNFNKWNDAYSFNQTSTRNDGSEIFGSDGYLSLQYGLNIPVAYANNFVFVGTISSLTALPTSNVKGYAYILQTSPNTKGTLYIYNGTTYDTSIPSYSWQIGTDSIYENTQFVTDVTTPSYFYEPNDDNKIFREFVFIKGLRVVVETMNKSDIPFELIELSPRLSVDLTGKLLQFDINKILSNLTQSAMPVGELLSSNGSLQLFDEDQSFNINNSWNGETGSIIAPYMQKNIQFKFYESIDNVNDANYYVPLKVFYSEGIPQTDSGTGTISLNMRDFFFYLESIKAPEILLTDVSLSQAVAILLDSIGFSNYVFKRLTDEKDPIIPYFFIPTDKNVAEVLNELAVSTQSAMFFDEYNNFVVMSKNYLLDNTGERTVDLTLYGSSNEIIDGINENTYNPPLSNILDIASQDQKVYNDGTINYTARYIQRSYGTFKQSLQTDEEKTWIYKPVLLWEVAGQQQTKSTNEEKNAKYTLSAMPLNSTLTSSLPAVSNRQIINNIIDFGENVFYISRYNGYFYANAEIIRYDAVEYAITGTGNLWISSNLEYQKYFTSLPFNGKMYPTGRVRIYSEPYYETVDGITYLKNGAVSEHGRGQFGTPITTHSSGLDDYWSSNNNVRGCYMDSKLLYTTELNPTIPETIYPTSTSYAGLSQVSANKSQRNGIIKNFMSSSFAKENTVSSLKSTQAGTVQSSALVFNGPDFETDETARDYITYVHKAMNAPYKHVGTRLRIIGKIESAGDMTQSPTGGMTYYNIPGTDPTQTVSIGGGSGGISIVNPVTNNGYYFEISALTTTNFSSYLNIDDTTGESTTAIDNVMFYKVLQSSGATSAQKATPKKLWGGNASIIVDDGNFTGQYRFVGEDNPSVYDLAIEYVDTNNIRTFYLYINGKLIKTVVDDDPIILRGTSIGLFVRGTSRVMFENIYALSQNYATNSVFSLNKPIAAIFGDDNKDINASEALNKYAISAVIQQTYLEGIRPTVVPDYSLYYEEFGTIMRECAYFNVKYDKAYPALYAKIAPTFLRLKGYVVSGFMASSYGAEFLIFNATDSIVNLDETTGNYLRIQGIAFTQDTTHTLTMDDFYKKRGNFSDPELKGDVVIRSPFAVEEEYDKIRTSRILYGKNGFNLDSNYIQSQDAAEDILGWISTKSIKPRKAIGLNIFSNPMIQLGDLVNIKYKDENGVDMVVSEDTNMIVYNIAYSRSSSGPAMTIYLSEV